jgi:hypothetical protein
MALVELDAPMYGHWLQQPNILLRSIGGSCFQDHPYFGACQRSMFDPLTQIIYLDYRPSDGGWEG